MNIKRGLFRLWAIFTVVFAGIVLVISADSLHREFKKVYSPSPWKDLAVLLVPTDCNTARGKKPTAEEFLDPPATFPKNADYTTEKDNPYCWYELPKFRTLYPEYKDLSDDELSDKLYAKAGLPTEHPHPWSLLGNTLLFALGPPILLLVFGRALLWAISGFRTSN